MSSEFPLAVKSTIDRAGKTLATTLGISDFIDIDDDVNVAQALSSQAPCILWKFHTLDEDPIDPLWHLTFAIGAKTSGDAANYDMLSFVSAVKDIFSVGDSLDVYDWSGDAVPTQKLGNISFIASGVDQQLSEKSSGVRLIAVEAKVIRFR